MATLFAYIDSICQKKPIEEDLDEFERSYTQFMVNRYFSCDRQLAPLANLLNDRNVTNKMHHDFMWSLVPKGKRWIKYNAKKEKADKHLKYIMDHYRCGMQQAKAYRKLISEEEMKQIIFFNEKMGRKGKK